MSWATTVAELLVGEPRSHAGGCRGGPCSRPWEQDIFQLRRNKGIQGPVAGAGGAGWGGGSVMALGRTQGALSPLRRGQRTQKDSLGMMCGKAKEGKFGEEK